MAVPDKVRRQAEQADLQHKALYGKEDAPPEDAVPTDAELGLAEGAEQDADADAKPKEGEAKDDGVAAQPVAPPDNAAQPPEADDANGDTWRSRYQSLQGKYNSEVPQYQQRLHYFQQRVDQLEQMVHSLQQQGGSPPEPQRGLNGTSSITPKDIEDYGEDFIDVVRRVAQDMARSEAAKVRNEVGTLANQVNGVTTAVTQTARERMYGILERRVPDWNTLNHDPGFNAWIGERDPFTGVVRKTLLNDAYTRNDGDRVAAFFESYLRETAAVAAQPPAQTPDQRPASQTPPGSTSQRRVTLDTMAEPGADAGTVGQPREKRVWTKADVANLYRRKAERRISDQEFQALERDLMVAQTDGRYMVQ